MRLQHLVIHSDRSVKLAALQALANMALNTTNQKEMEVSWHIQIGIYLFGTGKFFPKPTQRARTDLNKMSLPRPKITTA